MFLPWGIDDPRDLEKLVPRLRLVTAVSFLTMPELVKRLSQGRIQAMLYHVLAGARDECVTAEGAFDMMGNLHEWTADPAGTFRGGFYVDTAINGNGCLYATTAHDVSHWDYSTGFRCCATP